jgi:Fur family ferric uptake transcriptional regulator
MKEDLKTKLKRRQISVTKARLVILEAFLQAKEALTPNSFLNNTMPQLNRITVFRTLNLFVEKNIILRIPAANGVNRYLLLQTLSSVHSNFVCRGCKNVTQLKTLIRPKIKLPKGFKQQNMEIMIGGLCNSCKSRQ